MLHNDTLFNIVNYSLTNTLNNYLMRERERGREREKGREESTCKYMYMYIMSMQKASLSSLPPSLPPLSLSLSSSHLLFMQLLDHFPLVIDPELIALALTAVSSPSWYYRHWLIHSLMLLDQNHNRLWLDNCSSHNLEEGESGNNTCISKTKKATPTKIGVHALDINPYLHEFFEPILIN